MTATLVKPVLAADELARTREYIAQTGDIPTGSRLLQDSMPLVITESKKTLSESINGKKVPILRLSGVFQRADEKNANGRVYPHKILKTAVESMQDAVQNRRVMGEFDHPQDAKIHMDRVSHLITRMWMEGKTLYGEMEVLNDDRSPCGSLLSCYVDRKIQVGISSRGVGDMEEDIFEGEEAFVVQDGFMFVTFDAVAEPSVRGTQLEQIKESLQRRNKLPMREAREKLLLGELHKYFQE